MRLLTVARDLRRRRGREQRGLFVTEGLRTVEELLRSPLRVIGALAGQQLADSERGAALLAALNNRGVPVEEITPNELASATDTESPQGVLAIAEVPARHLANVNVTNDSRIVVLDAVQDPGNVGTIVRTAAALGAAATLAMPGTVDLWNAKVVRSAMGAHFHHQSMACTWDELDAFRASHNVAIWAADAAGEPLETLAGSAPAHLALIVGNEGSGLSDAARERAERMVALPIAAAVESLNVAVATGIFLYQLKA